MDKIDYAITWLFVTSLPEGRRKSYWSSFAINHSAMQRINSRKTPKSRQITLNLAPPRKIGYKGRTKSETHDGVYHTTSRLIL